jgi:hypothetical protein
MPHYFFSVRLISGPVIPDRIGVEFRNLAAARADAAEAVRQTIAEKKAAGEHVAAGLPNIPDYPASGEQEKSPEGL